MKHISRVGCEKTGQDVEPMENRLATGNQRVVNLIQRVTQQFLCPEGTKLRKMESLLDYTGVYNQDGLETRSQ